MQATMSRSSFSRPRSSASASRVISGMTRLCCFALRLRPCRCSLALGQQVGVLAADDAPVQRHVDVAAAEQHHRGAPLGLALAQQRGDADRGAALDDLALLGIRSEEHTSELQSLMRIPYTD